MIDKNTTMSDEQPAQNKRKSVPRKRTPLACLICKKRKVKCDKLKPACSECSRNNVAHLCQYLEPHWTANLTPGEVKQETLGESVTQSEEYLQLKSSNEKVINIQRKEIDDLKRQLSVLQHLSPPKVVETTDSLNVPITVLGKLCPSNVTNKRKLVVMDDHSYSIKPHKSNTYTDTYSWINLIKLDPQLTSLWFKITNLQKIYHTYKMNILIESKVPNRSNGKKSDYKINEIDFTSSKDSPSTEARCPVIECDFNFMNDDQDIASPSRSSSPFPAFMKTEHRNIKKEELPLTHEDVGEKGKKALINIQNLWNSTLNLTRGSEPLNYKQLYFLIDFYFNGSGFESKNLAHFYKLEIQGIIKKNGNEINLNLQDDSKRQNGSTDHYLFERLVGKGVYLCFLALIISESLDVLRSRIRSGDENDTSDKFKKLFPSEIVYLDNATNESSIMTIIQEFLLIDKTLGSRASPNDSLSHLSCCIFFLNQQLLGYKQDASGSRPGFTAVFTNFLKTVLNDASPVELWKDPDYVVLKDSKRKNKDLKIHMCYIWSHVIRLINLVTFNFVPILKHSETLDTLIQKLYVKVEESNKAQSHIRYLSDLKSLNYDEMKSNLQAHYLVSRISSALSFGIKGKGEVSLNMNNLNRLIRECDEVIQDLKGKIDRYPYEIFTDIHLRAESQPSSMVWYFELYSILSYLRYFMKYVILLEAEGLTDESLTHNLIPGLFIDLHEFVHHIRSVELSRLDSSQYVLSALVELLTRLIQFVIGLLIRSRSSDSNGSGETLLKRELDKQKQEIDKSTQMKFGCNIDHFINKRIVDIVEDTVTTLDNKVFDKDKSHKLSKLWKFYMTFISNSTKMNSINYAKLHSNVPEFRNNQSASACPVISTAETRKLEISKVEFKKCPISQITTPMDDFAPDDDSSVKQAGECPVDHGMAKSNGINLGMKKCPVTSFASKAPESKKRKCPFDHTSWNGSAYSKGVESNIRGKFHKSSPEVLKAPTPKSEELLMPPPIMGHVPVPVVSSPVSVQSTVTPLQPTAPPIVMDKPESNEVNLSAPGLSDKQLFNDFDFDFLHNDSFFDQLNLGLSGLGMDNMYVDGYIQ